MALTFSDTRFGEQAAASGADLLGHSFFVHRIMTFVYGDDAFASTWKDKRTIRHIFVTLFVSVVLLVMLLQQRMTVEQRKRKE